MEQETKERGEILEEEEPHADEPKDEPEDGARDEADGTHGKEKKERGKAKLEKKLNEAQEEIARIKDQWLRSQAEFQNFKRRNSATYAEAYAKGVEETLKAMLPVLDNLERALAAAEEDSPLKSGVEMTRKQFLECAGRMGLEEVPALGEAFDPEKHEAVMRCPSDTPGMVLEVFQKGYKVKDRIIRHPMVKVGTEE